MVQEKYITMLSDRKFIYKKILNDFKAGILFDFSKENAVDTFQKNAHKFSVIAHRIANKNKVLDIGPGFGIWLAVLDQLGHDVYAVDVVDVYRHQFPEIYNNRKINFTLCNAEVDDLPFEDNFFDAVTCSQTLEHFTHSHLHITKEIKRVLKVGGIVEIDVPNVASWRNRWRLIRGKNITWGYKDCYLYQEPISYNNMSFYPDRHNREFSRKELELLLQEGGFQSVETFYFAEKKIREGVDKIFSLGSNLRDCIPTMQKHILGFGVK